MYDKRAVGWFLVITFGITWGVEGVLLAGGVSFEHVPPVFLGYAVAALMWAPAVGAAITRKVILRESLRPPEARLRLRSRGIGCHERSLLMQRIFYGMGLLALLLFSEGGSGSH